MHPIKKMGFCHCLDLHLRGGVDRIRADECVHLGGMRRNAQSGPGAAGTHFRDV